MGSKILLMSINKLHLVLRVGGCQGFTENRKLSKSGCHDKPSVLTTLPSPSLTMKLGSFDKSGIVLQNWNTTCGVQNRMNSA